MGHINQSILRRWDGQTKVASVWDPMKEDPDISDINGNCLVYLSEPSFYRDKHSFVVPLDKLVAAKCPSLFETLTTIEESPSTKGHSRSRWKKYSYTLCLEASDLHNIEEAQLYHVTTRNFFAWVMRKPIVGPDPTSALLALKLRMDLWRAPTVDNLSDLHSYAKTQGYGDLGDVSMSLTNRSKGITNDTEGYKLVDEIRGEHLVTGDNKGVLISFFRKQLQSIQIRFSPFRYETGDRSCVESDVTSSHNRSKSDESFMSGAVSANSEISMKFAELPEAVKDSTTGVVASATDRSVTTKQTITQTLLGRRQQLSRTYSLPILPQGSIEGISNQLEKTSSWIECLARENVEREKTGTGSSLHTPSSGGKVSGRKPSSTSSWPPYSPSRPSTHRRRTSIQLSRPPSPIQEEVSDRIPPVPAKNPRRYSFDATDSDEGQTSAIPMPSPYSQKMYLPEACQTAEPGAISTPASAASSIMTTPCEPSLLPSQMLRSCRSCGKLKSPNSRRQSLTSLSPTTSNELQRKFSFESDIVRGKSARRWLPHDNMHLGIHPALRDSGPVLTRFPSLHKLETGKLSTDVENTNSSSAPASNRVTNHFHSRNRSEPNLRSSLASKARPRQKRVTIEIPKSNNTFASANSNREDGNSVQPRSFVSKSDTIHQGLPQRNAWATNVDTDSPVQDMHRLTPVVSHGVKQDLLSKIVSNPDIVDNHNARMEDERIYDSAISLMDTMLDNIALSDHDTSKTSSPTSETKYHSLAPSIEEINPTKLYVSTVTPVDHERESSKAKIPVKKRLRNSLRTWSSKKRVADNSPLPEYQGNILVMDAYGKFSTIASPVSGSDIDTEMNNEIAQRWEKRAKLVHELP